MVSSPIDLANINLPGREGIAIPGTAIVYGSTRKDVAGKGTISIEKRIRIYSVDIIENRNLKEDIIPDVVIIKGIGVGLP